METKYLKSSMIFVGKFIYSVNKYSVSILCATYNSNMLILLSCTLPKEVLTYLPSCLHSGMFATKWKG